MKINLGCGQTPTSGYRNFDNSFSIRLARIPLLLSLLSTFKLLSKPRLDFIKFITNNNIEYGDVVKGLPIKSNSCDVVYTSHMLEHLDRQEAMIFCQEAYRLLSSNGTLRIAVPDIRRKVETYNQTGDADQFIASTCMSLENPKALAQRIQLAFVGPRHHQWMYDGQSLSRLLESHGFTDIKVLPAGQTTMPDPGALNLSERSDESVYVEAKKP